LSQLAMITVLCSSGIPDSNRRPSAWEQVEGPLILDESSVSTGSYPSRDVSRCLVLTGGGGSRGGSEIDRLDVRRTSRKRISNSTGPEWAVVASTSSGRRSSFVPG
jgi:hypothetical protein